MRNAEAYRKGDRIVVVHHRCNGYVYYHERHISAWWVQYSGLYRIEEYLFDAQAKAGERFDVSQLDRAHQ
ncbi:hypothetical protein [Salisaeta icosahedral phage 1]|uniref:hypothetical protein n=1 Tax=Salisaeta icosahedral phage 1 TaxID=1183239 RepID=UPI00025EA918|nr:hypothetical protein A322_gp11 [Salisaeta icosahedral phage 1]AFJ21466.1 hypothetical protein [Salisaeta icosahedral phage 1]